jgi:hypothetical protein
MKINNADEILKSVYKESAPKNEKPGDKQFAEILKENLAPSCKSQPLSKNYSIVRSTPLVEIQPIKALGEDKSTVVERVYKFLNTLDDYRHKLRDPQVSLKEVDPVINRIKNENENLKPVLESLADGDELKEILNDVLVTASLEVIKYRRGDYINP